jgi:hypothetical protein
MTPKPKPRRNGHVGPTFVAKFADGAVTRMSVHTSLEKLDWDRGVHLSQAAWQSRWRRQHARYLKQIGNPRTVVAPVPPAIVAAHFEQYGKVLARYPNSENVAARARPS